jgi:hypothetical protein
MAPSKAMSLSWTAAYSAAAMLCGVAATAAVASLALAHVHLAFPSALRVLRFSMRAPKYFAAVRSTGDSLPRIAVITGLALLLVCVLLGNDHISWMTTRSGVGGNLPFVNFPGPKLWAAAAINESADRWLQLAWGPLVNRMTMIAINLTVFWLLAVPSRGERSGAIIRFFARWLPIATFGAAIALIHGINASLQYDPDSFRTEFFAAATICCELPSTILLYVLLARIAEDCDEPRLARHFRGICFAIVALVSTALLAFVISKHALYRRGDWPFLVIASGYGAGALLAAAWSIASVVRLIRAVLGPTNSPGHARG